MHGYKTDDHIPGHGRNPFQQVALDLVQTVWSLQICSAYLRSSSLTIVIAWFEHGLWLWVTFTCISGPSFGKKKYKPRWQSTFLSNHYVNVRSGSCGTRTRWNHWRERLDSGSHHSWLREVTKFEMGSNPSGAPSCQWMWTMQKFMHFEWGQSWCLPHIHKVLRYK